MSDSDADGITSVRVREAQFPGELHVVRGLMECYFRWLAANEAVPAQLRNRDRTPELNEIERRYAEPNACLLLALANEQVCGCAAVHLLPAREHAAELKRLYVAPEARGCGAGRALIQASATWAREHGAHELLLDTLPEAMPSAVRLYRSLGFQPTARYNENEGCCFAFFRLSLG